jgi:serine/threonine protein phosphatase PrpC
MIPQLWRVAGASVAGSSHEKLGAVCQDSHAWKALPNGILVLAAADGAGSASAAEIGSSIAARESVKVAVDVLGGAGDSPSDELLKDALDRCFDAALQTVNAEAGKRGIPSRELATTLIVAAVGRTFAAAAQIGDGAMVAADREQNIFSITTPQCGEYINEVTFLTSPKAAESRQFGVRRTAIAHAAVLTDGVQMLALRMPEGQAHAPFFAPLFRFNAAEEDVSASEEKLRSFLRSDRVRMRADDDLTILLASAIAGEER